MFNIVSYSFCIDRFLNEIWTSVEKFAILGDWFLLRVCRPLAAFTESNSLLTSAFTRLVSYLCRVSSFLIFFREPLASFRRFDLISLHIHEPHFAFAEGKLFWPTRSRGGLEVHEGNLMPSSFFKRWNNL